MKSYGFMGKLLRVDLTEGKVMVEETNQVWAKQYLGGAGLATKYLYEEVPGGVDPRRLRRQAHAARHRRSRDKLRVSTPW